MMKAGEVVRLILFVMGDAFVLQVPLFIALLKLAEIKGCENAFTRAGQVVLLDSGSGTGPMTTVEIKRTSVSGSSHSSGVSSRSPFQPLSFSNYPFVLFSVYKHTLNSFYVLGTASVIVRRYENELLVYRCKWLASPTGARSGGELISSQEAVVVTKARMLQVSFDENGMLYVTAVVNCTLNQSVGAHGKGGVLRLHLSKGPSFWEPHHAVEDVFREKPGEVEGPGRWLSEANEMPEELLRHKFAFYGPPMYRIAHNRDWIPKGLAYHHYL